jgi:predicted nuclease with TOPRIM domain
MANETDNLILVHLRDIRATLAEHTARFDRIDERLAQIDVRFGQIDERFGQMDERFAQIDERFDQMDKRFDRMEHRFDDLRNVVNHTFALSSANSLKVQEFDRRHQFSEGEQQRISGRVDELEHRLSEVEKKIDE